MSITNETVMALRPLEFEVQSETDPAQVYLVRLPYCSCPDMRYRRNTPASPFCKHLRQAFKMAGWQVPEPAGPASWHQLDHAAAHRLLRGQDLTVAQTVGVLKRAREHAQGTYTLRGGRGALAVIYDRDGDFYDVELPA